MNNGVVVFVEGDMDREFYQKLLNNIRSLCNNKRFHVSKVEVKNVKGVGNYKKNVRRIFENQILNDYKGYNFTLFLCHDTDVDDSPKPPIEWGKVKESLLCCGAKRVVEIKAKKSIEDWFLYDKEGVCSYLKLPSNIKISGKNSIQKMQKLFIKANRVYIKGSKCNDLINALDIKKIMRQICKEIRPLCNILGVKCKGDKCDSNKA